MKKTFKTLTALLATATLAFGLTACNDKEPAKDGAKTVSSLEQIQKDGKVRIGVFSDKPPFGFVDAQGKSQGFDVEIGKAIAKDLLGDESKAEFILVDAANRAEYLVSNKVDIILANFTVTPARQEVVDFANPYMKVALGVVSKDGSVITDLAQLKDKTLIVDKGTTADIYFSKKYPDVKLLKFEQNTETFEALRDGRGDALSNDNTFLFAWAKQNPGYTVGIKNFGDQDVIAPAVKKGDSELLNWLNEEIVKLSKDGYLKQAYQKTLAPVYGDSVSESDILVEYK